MPGFGEGSPFGQVQPTDLSAMLQAAFAAMPQGGGQLDYMPLPQHQQQQDQFIDLGAGGPAPGSARQNGLTALGGGLSAIGQTVGSAMSAAKPAPVDNTYMNELQFNNPMPASPTTPWVTKNPFGP